MNIIDISNMLDDDRKRYNELMAYHRNLAGLSYMLEDKATITKGDIKISYKFEEPDDTTWDIHTGSLNYCFGDIPAELKSCLLEYLGKETSRIRSEMDAIDERWRKVVSNLLSSYGES